MCTDESSSIIKNVEGSDLNHDNASLFILLMRKNKKDSVYAESLFTKLRKGFVAYSEYTIVSQEQLH